MIPFPKMHIAASVINRIFNTLDGEPQLAIPQFSPLPPTDPSALGQHIDESVAEPPAPTAVPPEQQQAADASMETASVQGGSPFDGALVGAMPNAY